MKTPEQQAQEYDFDAIEKLFLADPDTAVCNYPSYENGYIAGHAAGKQDERERILAILDHGCGQAPVQFTYAELRREIHEITEEDCYTGGEKV